jgi:hypothetical protein
MKHLYIFFFNSFQLFILDLGAELGLLNRKMTRLEGYLDQFVVMILWLKNYVIDGSRPTLCVSSCKHYLLQLIKFFEIYIYPFLRCCSYVQE